MNQFQLGIGLGLAVLVGGLARLTGALTPGGAAAASLVGGVTFGFGGLAPAILLLGFFTTSSLVSRVGASVKQRLASRMAKGSRRDEGQVLANGIVPAMLAIGFGLSGELSWLVGFSGALAASNADTWATELGVLAKSPPRLITSGRPVEPGTSGAVSWIGSLAALAGSLWIAGLGAALAEYLLEVHRNAALGLATCALAGGLAAAFFDSLLGATLQAVYRCPRCDQETERRPLHTCGASTVLIRGHGWLGNDAVNLFAAAVGGVLAVGLWLAIGRLRT